MNRDEALKLFPLNMPIDYDAFIVSLYGGLLGFRHFWVHVAPECDSGDTCAAVASLPLVWGN